ncbi:MAG: DNA repair protein RadA [Cyclobacteriaceae bacterium]
MAKTKTTYFCQNCGAQAAKWLGKCPSCHEWNTYVEEVVATGKADKRDWKQGAGASERRVNKPQTLQEITYHEEERTDTNDKELNRVLGGGIVPGSLVLIGGEPGIGKSTLMLQIALKLSGMKILYISGEESARQIKMRASRMKAQSDTCYILTETGTQQIFKQLEHVEPDMVVVDSIQTMHSAHLDSAAGSISQVRECTAEFMKYAKETGTPVFLIGHITKEGTLAGPKVLEHMVDTVLQFEGDRHLAYRILRTTKNRFGSTSELGLYEMLSDGLREVSNPSEILITQRDEGLSGVAIGATLEGNRPLLIEIQSLVSISNYGTPQRSSTGFDNKRLNMLLAVLEKRVGFKLGAQDVFINLAGGLKIEDPAMDLAVAMALVSSFEDLPIGDKICFAAETGLGGELRAVNRLEQRISEAAKLGFKIIYVSRFGIKGLDTKKYDIEIKAMGKLHEVIRDLWG